MTCDMAIATRRLSICLLARRTIAVWSALVVVAPHVLLADDQSVQVRDERRGNDIELVATSANCAYAVISVTTELTNMRATSPLTVETAGQLRLVVATLSIVDPSQRWTYKYRYDWKAGGRGGRATQYDYSLPFRGTFELLQGPQRRDDPNDDSDCVSTTLASRPPDACGSATSRPERALRASRSAAAARMRRWSSTRFWTIHGPSKAGHDSAIAHTPHARDRSASRRI